MACMEFVLFEFFSVLLLVVKDGDVFTTGGHFRGVDVQLLKYVRCVKLCTKVITLLISGKEFCLACFYHTF